MPKTLIMPLDHEASVRKQSAVQPLGHRRTFPLKKIVQMIYLKPLTRRSRRHKRYDTAHTLSLTRYFHECNRLLQLEMVYLNDALVAVEWGWV